MAFTLRGDDVCQKTLPTPLPDPYWVAFSPSAAQCIGIPLSKNALPSDPKWLDVLAGNALETEKNQFLDPLSTVYSGHQFGVWAGQLGDGRAILLGDIGDQELQLKGAGMTRYSRMGDGRAVLRSSIREFLCSEAMHALGIPTSRALAVVGSKLPVRRETIETAAVCSRFAPSFIRIGHFEHFASLQNLVRLKELADLLIADHFTECLQSKAPYLELFKGILGRNAKLLAQWQAVGFCHGVLNSDNISVLGLTIDYGPFGFLDQFQVDHICNHSDHSGRYAYHRQPQIMHWNMACLASAFLPLLELDHSDKESQDLLHAEIDTFPVIYAQEWQRLFRAKLGLQQAEESDIALIENLMQMMHASRVDFTGLFRGLSDIKKDSEITSIRLRDEFVDREQIDQWLGQYIHRLQSESLSDHARALLMNQTNPKFILRNHLAQVAIEKAQQDDFTEIATLLSLLNTPYDEHPDFESYALPPPIDMPLTAVSCSS
ncbi:Uncharacterized conserved protein YdiU, UPF0061 family [Polynucleobacter meluiroseus]|uniref:Protein nucleotidyltransferase YdiU n=1 Tax=Polynucleobacter meluiroseus TaxID=1938814 RepID=A0A240E247_9BURK|nr:YdiU family protein [Polynucleobacter meluiroseus]SNX28561.1 Uncharacterized conserved protein YdiU, UPF0061 family [Polynucleobacter meluiroseus]